MNPLNHGSKSNATGVQTSGGKVLTVVHEYKDRLAAAMKGAKVSTAELARDLDLSFQAVKKVLNGGKFGMDNNLKAAKRLGVRSEWLATGKGLMTEPPAAHQRPELREIAEALSKLDKEQFDFAMQGIRYALEAAPLKKPADNQEDGGNDESSSSFRRAL
jgi:transcriptional regulator with XRE-family HTH domain